MMYSGHLILVKSIYIVEKSFLFFKGFLWWIFYAWKLRFFFLSISKMHEEVFMRRVNKLFETIFFHCVSRCFDWLSLMKHNVEVHVSLCPMCVHLFCCYRSSGWEACFTKETFANACLWSSMRYLFLALFTSFFLLAILWSCPTTICRFQFLHEMIRNGNKLSLYCSCLWNYLIDTRCGLIQGVEWYKVRNNTRFTVMEMKWDLAIKF